MSEAVTALCGASYAGLVTVAEVPLQGMITLRGDLSSKAVKNAATGVAGVDMPGTGGENCVGERGICWMSPDELLILCPYAEVAAALEKMTATLGDSHALAVDVSDARASFQLSGAGVRDVLAKLTPADVTPGAFEPGLMRRSRLAQVPAAFWMRDAETVQVICFRSVARYVFDLLCNAADPDAAVGMLGNG